MFFSLIKITPILHWPSLPPFPHPHFLPLSRLTEPIYWKKVVTCYRPGLLTYSTKFLSPNFFSLKNLSKHKTSTNLTSLWNFWHQKVWRKRNFLFNYFLCISQRLRESFSCVEISQLRSTDFVMLLYQHRFSVLRLNNVWRKRATRVDCGEARECLAKV